MTIIKSCKNAQAYFAPYTDDTLGEPESQALREHLQGCPDCLAKLALARQALLLLRQLQEEDVTLPEGFEARLMQHIIAGDLAMDALDFSWQAFLNTLVQMLEMLFGLLGIQPEQMAQPAL